MTFDIARFGSNCCFIVMLLYLRQVRTSASIRFEAASISFALHRNFPGSGSKVDRFDLHTVGGLK